MVEACRCLWLAQSRMCFKEEGPGQFPFFGLPDVWEEEAESLSKHIPGDSVPPSTVSFWQCRGSKETEELQRQMGPFLQIKGQQKSKSRLWILLLGGATIAFRPERPSVCLGVQTL